MSSSISRWRRLRRLSIAAVFWILLLVLGTAAIFSPKPAQKPIALPDYSARETTTYQNKPLSRVVARLAKTAGEGQLLVAHGLGVAEELVGTPLSGPGRARPMAGLHEADEAASGRVVAVDLHRAAEVGEIASAGLGR